MELSEKEMVIAFKKYLEEMGSTDNFDRWLHSHKTVEQGKRFRREEQNPHSDKTETGTDPNWYVHLTGILTSF